MDVKDLIELADIKENQARALLAYYIPKLENGEIKVKELQNLIDKYCNNMAETFIETHKQHLLDKELNQLFRNHMRIVGADKPYSGHRFYEALYKTFDYLKNDIEEVEGVDLVKE